VNHHATSRFWACYETLPAFMRDLADANFELLKNNPRHPSLHLKKVNQMWSVRVGRKYRALAIEDDGTLIWFWIGTHAEYDKLVA
jgi:hypothetical protein